MLKGYQEFTRTTARYPEEIAISYLLLGLCSEVGEVADKFKKLIRDGGEIDVEAVSNELGDVIWYMTRLADEMGLSLEEVINQNVRKLSDRKARGTLKGSGDDR